MRSWLVALYCQTWSFHHYYCFVTFGFQDGCLDFLLFSSQGFVSYNLKVVWYLILMRCLS